MSSLWRVLSVTGEGNPFCDTPTPDRIAEIQSLTSSDDQGRIYYRLHRMGMWKRLRTAADYEALNDALGVAM